MRVVVQRVSQASVQVDGEIAGRIGGGLLVYLSVAKGDSEADCRFMADKLVNLRIFADESDKMNLSVRDVEGSILMISQFTLHGDCRRGRRPGFDQAASPELARQLYEYTIELLQQQGVNVATGVFAAHMHVESVNDGPVTFLLDSSRLL